MKLGTIDTLYLKDKRQSSVFKDKIFDRAHPYLPAHHIIDMYNPFIYTPDSHIGGVVARGWRRQLKIIFLEKQKAFIYPSETA